jgi:hypothetical protein
VKNPIRYCETLLQGRKRSEFTPELALNVAAKRQSERARTALKAERDQAVVETFREAPWQLPNALKNRGAVHEPWWTLRSNTSRSEAIRHVQCLPLPAVGAVKTRIF